MLLALPLGLGKANTITNALTDLALEDSSIHLHIITALTLRRPVADSDLQVRFLGPAMDRLFGAYTPLDYATRLADGTLPDNIRVQEFFFQAGDGLGNAAAQQGYIAANYTHALDFLMARRPNVIAQLLAQDDDRVRAVRLDFTIMFIHGRTLLLSCSRAGIVGALGTRGRRSTRGQGDVWRNSRETGSGEPVCNRVPSSTWL
ncbi:hypothetical protein [Roseovarius nitratireducens]|uniref:hypothetical protein n=1 Tax=Roseovarius nitratireducens TaxID=2044597 RepID=UPI00101AD91C|nr:hypothetical protein [Roseovarius nitratireducens]